MFSPGLYPFEALAEIFDFVAGFVQRVPKKTNAVKSDLQNSTAKLPRKRKLEGERIGLGYVKDIYLDLLFLSYIG